MNGVYDRGGSRTNSIEAQAIVDDIIARLKSGEFPGGTASIGVVTFNAEQQRLIEDLLDAERGKDPALEQYFALDNPERVFVKNLESVQGDERDCMYFSITYGPDKSSIFSLNFGPMNKAGGERRLNVAITRARHELKVFVSFQPDRIDDTRTKSIGMRDLKHFLRFAQRGVQVLREETSGSRGGVESPFEEAVLRALQARGWQLGTQIGVSSFRVDLGVIHPDSPGRYLAGVECDGATYHRAATARDRDKLRQQVLHDLGWQIVRVWSTDWWINPRGTAEKLHAQLTALLKKDREQAALKN